MACDVCDSLRRSLSNASASQHVFTRILAAGKRAGLPPDTPIHIGVGDLRGQSTFKGRGHVGGRRWVKALERLVDRYKKWRSIKLHNLYEFRTTLMCAR